MKHIAPPQEKWHNSKIFNFQIMWSFSTKWPHNQKIETFRVVSLFLQGCHIRTWVHTHIHTHTHARARTHAHTHVHTDQNGQHVGALCLAFVCEHWSAFWWCNKLIMLIKTVPGMNNFKVTQHTCLIWMKPVTCFKLPALQPHLVIQFTQISNGVPNASSH
jgi:hypothetical protein